jgi:hypothetical protein
LDYELNDWIILESLHKFLNDVEEIEMLERSNKKQLPFSIITDILNLIHDITPLRYSETKQQSNGSVTYEVRSPYKDKRIAGKLR